jgi:serine/threonine protein kinase
MSAPAMRSDSPHVGITLFDRFRIAGYLRADACGDRYIVKPIGGGSSAVARVLTHPVFVRGVGTTWDNVRKRLSRLTMIDHPNVERFLSSGIVHLDDRPYFCVVAGQSPGPTLDARMVGRQRIPAAEAIAIAQRIAHGLAAVHQLGLVHGDLRASNIKLAQGVERSDVDTDTWPVLTDACLANLVFDAFGRAPSLRELLFAPEFTAPEQIEGEFTSVATDVYSFGLVMYRMLTGSAPFIAGDSNEMVVAKLTTSPMSLRESGYEAALPPSVDAMLSKCLARLPRDRYESMPALLRALQECQRDLTTPRTSSFLSSYEYNDPLSSEVVIDLVRRSVPPSALVSEVAPVEPVTVVEPLSPVTEVASSVSAEIGSVVVVPQVSSMVDDTAFLELFGEVLTLKRMMAVSLAVTCGALALTGISVFAHRDPVMTASLPLQRHTVRFVLRSNVHGATATVRGRSYAVPVRVELPVGNDPELVEVSAPGYTTRRTWQVLADHTEAQIDLEPIAEVPSQSLVAAPALAVSAPTQVRYLSNADIRHFIRAHIPEIRSCVAVARADNPMLSGRVTIAMTLAPDGRVRDTQARRNDMTQPVADCLTRVIRGIAFPATGHQSEIVRTYSFHVR